MSLVGPVPSGAGVASPPARLLHNCDTIATQTSQTLRVSSSPHHTTPRCTGCTCLRALQPSVRRYSPVERRRLREGRCALGHTISARTAAVFTRGSTRGSTRGFTRGSTGGSTGGSTARLLAQRVVCSLFVWLRARLRARLRAWLRARLCSALR